MSKRHMQETARPVRTRIAVSPRPDGWAVEGFPSGTEQAVYKTQREAIAAARKLVGAKAGGELVVCGRDGRIRAVDTYVVGADGFARINAVEGIHLSEDLQRDFHTLDRKRLTADERRAWLIAKYGRDRVRRRT